MAWMCFWCAYNWSKIALLGGVSDSMKLIIANSLLRFVYSPCCLQTSYISLSIGHLSYVVNFWTAFLQKPGSFENASSTWWVITRCWLAGHAYYVRFDCTFTFLRVLSPPQHEANYVLICTHCFSNISSDGLIFEQCLSRKGFAAVGMSMLDILPGVLKMLSIIF